MAITKVTGWFSKPGKGFPQVELKNFDGTPQKDAKGNAVIGNEQYQSEQLTDDSVSAENAAEFQKDVLEACNGDLAFAAECFRTGWNRITRLKTGGLDEYQKSAKVIISLGLPWAKGKTVDEVAEILRTQMTPAK